MIRSREHFFRNLRGDECFLVLHIRRQDTEMVAGASVKVMLTVVT